MNNYKEQLQIIKQGIDEIIGEKELIAKLKKGKKLNIITTEKDYFRISENLREKINFIEIDLEIDNETKFLELII